MLGLEPLPYLIREVTAGFSLDARLRDLLRFLPKENFCRLVLIQIDFDDRVVTQNRAFTDFTKLLERLSGLLDPAARAIVLPSPKNQRTSHHQLERMNNVLSDLSRLHYRGIVIRERLVNVTPHYSWILDNIVREGRDERIHRDKVIQFWPYLSYGIPGLDDLKFKRKPGNAEQPPMPRGGVREVVHSELDSLLFSGEDHIPAADNLMEPSTSRSDVIRVVSSVRSQKRKMSPPPARRTTWRGRARRS